MANLDKPKIVGGEPITIDVAVELRQLVFGSAAAPPRGEWTRTGIIFPPHNQDLSFGLRCPRNSTRGLHSALQSYIIKYFVFETRPRDSCPVEQILKPKEGEQIEALVKSIGEILWMIGEKLKTTVVIPGEIPHIAHSHKYFQDTVTERLYLFEFTSLMDLQVFVKRYISYFTEDHGPGALLLLYSAVFTRSLSKVRADLDAPKGAHLMGPHEEGSLNIIALLLTGRATPYLHNGVIYVGDDNHYAIPQYGVLSRCVIGLMVFEGDSESANSAKQPGSRLKTPGLPIWVTSCCGHYGVIFNTNRELLRNYHAEKRFELYYYTCAGCFMSLTVDNRVLEDENMHSSSSHSTLQSDTNSSPIERLIQTKWQSAKITIHGGAPPSMNF